MVAHGAFKCDIGVSKCDIGAFKCDIGAFKWGDAAFKFTDKIAPATAFAASGGVSDRMRPNPGCRSLRSLALGWGLITPSGCSLNACVQNEIQNYIHETTEPNKNK